MDKRELSERLEENARTIYAYCMARTKNQHDAQDLAQEILLEICTCSANLRDERAFYGFMWSVAGNVYKRWCRKRLREKRMIWQEKSAYSEDTREDEELLDLLRRELALLSKRYREAAILYYVRNQSCEEIAATLSISVSMVKYLLFKTRQIVKEGMNLERHYGEQSYHPRTLGLQFWGCGSDRYTDVCKSRIAQNILFACYQDKLTMEQISLEIGVMPSYIEDDLEALCNCGLIKREGKRYSTNVIVFCAELVQEIRRKAAPCVNRIGQMIEQFMLENEAGIRKIGFCGSDMTRKNLIWQITAMILYRSVVVRCMNERMPNRSAMNCLIWAVEHDGQAPYAVGISNGQNERGDYIQFMDFAAHGEMVHSYCCSNRFVVSLLLDIARQNTGHFSKNDWTEIAEMIRRGYVISDGSCIRVNMPVFTQRQYDQLLQLMEETVQFVDKQVDMIAELIGQILNNHVPLHLRRSLPEMAYLRLLEDGISAVIERLVMDRVLMPWHGGEMLPTTYIVLKDD